MDKENTEVCAIGQNVVVNILFYNIMFEFLSDSIQVVAVNTSYKTHDQNINETYFSTRH